MAANEAIHFPLGVQLIRAVTCEPSVPEASRAPRLDREPARICQGTLDCKVSSFHDPPHSLAVSPPLRVFRRRGTQHERSGVWGWVYLQVLISWTRARPGLPTQKGMEK
jgi:hypothetical protein